MKVFTALPADRHELVHPVDAEDWETFYVLLNGRSQKESWRPVAVKIITKEYDGSPFAQTVSPWLGSYALILKQDGVVELRDYLSRIGEILPLNCSDERLHLWHPLAVIDALDISVSEVRRFESGRIMGITRHGFVAERLRGIEAFKIPDLRVSPVFYTESAARQISRVVGTTVEFKLVWSATEEGPNQMPEATAAGT
jgi:hypothetical protein